CISLHFAYVLQFFLSNLLTMDLPFLSPGTLYHVICNKSKHYTFTKSLKDELLTINLLLDIIGAFGFYRCLDLEPVFKRINSKFSKSFSSE
ncbi:MAG: hypothetical protein LBK29_01680, partial [Oscillospiraceae bacterium]|nr:hypothetical protein [Oscillospiraceae bacterium]